MLWGIPTNGHIGGLRTHCLHSATTALTWIINLPSRDIIQCKINRAKQLLRDREIAIADVAHDLEFSHQIHLNYHFKRLVELTPKVFQKNQ
ncbi:helix-turn-helix domain-containing protein [Halomicronema hongdechloris]|uniref:helix-turn-helix domain-containing protein n=1 Tax=Halomicronema hongdechloris TaxID=1209493 RepID=UPI0009BA9279